MSILNKLGCDGIQGYYFSKPLPKEEIEGWLEKGKCSVDKKKLKEIIDEDLIMDLEGKSC